MELVGNNVYPKGSRKNNISASHIQVIFDRTLSNSMSMASRLGL